LTGKAQWQPYQSGSFSVSSCIFAFASAMDIANRNG
ncbi:hypothetical protein N323_06552, partial [Cathartes aura]